MTKLRQQSHLHWLGPSLSNSLRHKRGQTEPYGQSLVRQLASRDNAAPRQQQPMASRHLAAQAAHQTEQGIQTSHAGWVGFVTLTSNCRMTTWPFTRVLWQCALKCCLSTQLAQGNHAGGASF